VLEYLNEVLVLVVVGGMLASTIIGFFLGWIVGDYLAKKI
jgi:hypothetical protein